MYSVINRSNIDFVVLGGTVMDDYILQILKANSVAKDQVQDTLDAHADDIEEIKNTKQRIDQEVQAHLETETKRIEAKSQSFYEALKPKYDQEYQERVQDLVDRFKSAESKWYQELLEGIIIPHGE